MLMLNPALLMKLLKRIVRVLSQSLETVAVEVRARQMIVIVHGVGVGG